MLKLKKASFQDINEMQNLFAHARDYMRRNGNPTQWNTSRPPLFLIEKDMNKGVTFMVYDDDQIVGTFSYTVGIEPTYRSIDGSWLNNKPYGTIHRIASNEKSKGIFKFALDYAESLGFDIRIDTHYQNSTMLHLFDHYGFKYCGEILIDDGTTRKAYQKELNNNIEVKIFDHLTNEASDLRNDVFCLEQGISKEDEYVNDDHLFTHLEIFNNNTLVAYGRYNFINNVGHIGRVLVKKEFRGKQYGRLLMSLLEEELFKKGIKNIELNAQIRVSKFYSLCGYKQIGEEFLDASIPHIKMIKELK